MHPYKVLDSLPPYLDKLFRGKQEPLYLLVGTCPEETLRAHSGSRSDPTLPPIVAVGIEATAPRLWKRLPQERREEVAYISRLLSTTQEFANAGFPEGTNHGLSHVAGVLRRADDLVSHLKPGDFNNVEAYLLLLAVLLHDAALFQGRVGHANPTRILEVINTLQLPIDFPLRAPIARIAAAHSGHGRIEELPELPTVVSPAMHRADMRAIAAVLRLSDEIAEDAMRTSQVVLESTKPMSQPFHEFSAMAFCGFELKDGLGNILIQITCQENRLSSTVGAADKPRTLLAHFLDRCLKIEAERQYCSRFLPKGIRLDSTRLRILDTLSSRPWLDTLVPSSSRHLRTIVYNTKPSLLIPTKESHHDSSIEAALILSLQECLDDNLVAVAGNENVFWIILEGDDSLSAGSMLDLISTQLHALHRTPVILRAITLGELLSGFSLGVPEILRLVRRGQCLLASSTFEALKRIASQSLRFLREPLLERLSSDCTAVLEQIETAKTLLRQVYNCHRLITMISQIIAIRKGGESATISTLLGLSEMTTLRRYVKRADVSSSLIKMAAKVNGDRRNLASGSLHAGDDPKDFYLDAAYAWLSLLDAPHQR